VVVVLIVVGISGLLFLYAGVPWIYGRLDRILLERWAKERQALVLTFDDGPGSSLTPAILDVLAESKVKATFFLLGRNIAGREAIVRQIAEQGHEICSHGYDHLHSWKVSPLRALSDIKRGWAAIDAALGTGRQKYPFRPPNGKLNVVCMLYLLFRHVPIVYWSVDSGDTWRQQPDSHRLARLVEKLGGAVSLAHDFDREDENTSRFVIESVRAALAMATARGMQVLTVSELLGIGR
jgi:peptidoglycan/xylan/chitin deacetylase (PgdA/CDA1 family)